MKVLFEKQRSKTLVKLNKKALNIPSILLNVESEGKSFVVNLAPIVREVIKQEGDLALDMMSVDSEVDMDDPEITNYLRTTPIKFSKEVNTYTNKRIRTELENGISAGEGINKLSDRISRVFDVASGSRANSIARTETSRAMNFGTERSYIQSGVVEGKEWLTAFDERTCEQCAEMNGRVVALGENYFEKGDTFQGISLDYDDTAYPPLHVSCRCTLIPVIKDISTIVPEEFRQDLEDYDLCIKK